MESGALDKNDHILFSGLKALAATRNIYVVYRKDVINEKNNSNIIFKILKL